jgi:uncharacterized protein
MRLWLRVMSISALMVVACASAKADLASASAAYKAQDYPKALAEYRELAEIGNAQSQYILGIMYFNGQGTNRNQLVGYGWIRLAADADYAQAKEAEPKMRAEIADENVERAQGLLKRFAPDALNSRIYPKILENCEYEDMVPAKRIQKSVSFDEAVYPAEPRRKGIEGSVNLELLIGVDGTVRDVNAFGGVPPGVFEVAATQWAESWKYTPALQKGNPTASTLTTMTIFKIDSSTADYSKANGYVKELRHKAEQGEAAYQYTYALILAGHPHYKKPWSESLPWFLKAAQAGMAPAQYRVGLSLLRGQGCEKDLVKAREWLLLAAQQAHPEAQVELARLSLKVGPQYEPDKAVFWLDSAVKGGSINAKKYLASILAASPVEKLRDPTRAQMLIEEVLQSKPKISSALRSKRQRWLRWVTSTRPLLQKSQLCS